MIHATTHSGRRPTAMLRRETLALIRDLRFCLVPLPSGEYNFAGVHVCGSEKPPEVVEFLVYLMEARTPAQVLRALPNAAQACHFSEAFSAEIGAFFLSLARTLKYNATAFVIEPAQRPDIGAALASDIQSAATSLTAPASTLASFPTLPDLPELPDLPLLPATTPAVEPPTAVCEADSTFALIVAA